MDTNAPATILDTPDQTAPVPDVVPFDVIAQRSALERELAAVEQRLVTIDLALAADPGTPANAPEVTALLTLVRDGLARIDEALGRTAVVQ